MDPSVIFSKYSKPLGRHAARQVVELVQNRFCEEHVEAALSLHQRVPSQLVDEILPAKRTCLEMYQRAGCELKESYDHNTITGYCSLAPVPSLLPASRARMCIVHCKCIEPEYLDEIQTKVLRVFLLVIYSHLYSYA
jgi:hypothetical protein